MTSCFSKNEDICKGQILDFEMNSFDEPNNKLINYYNTNSFVEIKDTFQLLRFEEPDRIPFYFEKSSIDTTKRKYTYKVKEAIIKMDKYQWDLLALIDNDQIGDNIIYWLKSYNNKRKQIGHLDFAFWSTKNKSFSSGRIDCDSTLHMIMDNGKEDRVFKTDDTGKNNLIEKIRK